MPYTEQELQDVDFYREFIDKKSRDYLTRLAESAEAGFKMGPNKQVRVLFEDIETGMGIENANFNSPAYNQFETALSIGAGQRLLDVLNAEYNAYLFSEQSNSNAGSDAGAMTGPPANTTTAPGDVPTQYFITDIISNIETLSTTVYNGKYRDTLKSGQLEQIIDRSISELADVQFANPLPNGISNRDVITNEFASDSRKWLIDNNQKRIYPDLNTFYGSNVSFSDLKTLTMTVLNTIPDGEPVE